MTQLLSKDEIVVRHMRTHIRAVLDNIVAEIPLLAGGILATVYMPPEWESFSLAFMWAIVLVTTLPLFLMPVLRWASPIYTLTSKRVITRRGILNRHGHDLPLSRIPDVASERNLVDRLSGCGTLTLQTPSDDPLVLYDIPKIDYVQLGVSDLLFDDVQGTVDADPEQVE